jgi:hypothetical protein
MSLNSGAVLAISGNFGGYLYRARSSAFGSLRTTSGAFGSGPRHFLDCHRPPTPGFAEGKADFDGERKQAICIGSSQSG